MKRFLTAFTLFLCLGTSILWAIPAKRTPMTFTQPDGTTVTVVLQGDEHFHYYATTDGVMVSKGEDGHFYYATINNNGIVEASSILAHNKDNRKTIDTNFINQLNDQDIREKITSRFAKSNKRNSPLKVKEVPNNGTPRILVLLIQYDDIKFSEGNQTKAQYTKRISQKDYTDGRDHGSVRDYFIAQSRGKFDPQFDVIGPVTLSNDRAYYGANNRNGDDVRPGEMIKEACEIAKNEGLIPDFSVYDNDGDKTVDVVYTIYAGVGEASSNEANSIWPHQWELSSALGGAVTIDSSKGIKIDKYACNNELYGNEIDGIGTFCHEFSHCLGLPDFYDTVGNNFGMNAWSLMDYGSYNDDGHTPCGYTSYEREFMGWMDITTLDTPASIKLNALNTDDGQAYRIVNSANKNEYYLLENRQQTGWDSAMAGHGMLAIHVDYNANAWNGNTVNNTTSHQRMTILPADGSLSTRSLEGDPYPGTVKTTSILSFKVFTGTPLTTPITNIKENDEIISFDFMEGSIETPIAQAASNLTTTSFIANWEAVEDAESYTLVVTKAKQVMEGELIMDEDFSGFATLNKDAEVTDLDLYTKEPGWEGDYIYSSNNESKKDQCRIGTAKNAGYLLTPNYDLSGNEAVTVVITAGKFNSKDNTPTLFIGLANMDEEELIDEAETELTDKLEKYYAVLNGGDATSYIQLETDGTKPRVYIDDITIYSGDISMPLDAQNIKRLVTKTDKSKLIKKQKTCIAKAASEEDMTFTTSETSYQVTGLEENATYTYRVKANKENKESTFSNTIKVDLSMATGISCDPLEVAKLVYTNDNEIIVSTEVGKLVQVYSIDGVLRNSIVTENGENHITAANGIYIVRIGNQSVKVVVSGK